VREAGVVAGAGWILRKPETGAAGIVN
jgi:hypothetical protein